MNSDELLEELEEDLILRAEFGKAVEEQNALIDEAKKHNREKAHMIDVKPSLRSKLRTYYTDMIGYRILDGEIYFRHLIFASDTDNLTSSVFTKRIKDE